MAASISPIPETNQPDVLKVPAGSSPKARTLSKGRLAHYIIASILVCLPALALLLLIREHRVNIAFLDDWMFVHMFEKDVLGTLTLQDYFMVQMEHRMAFVRGVIMLFHQIWPTDWTKQMFFTWVLLALTQLNLAVLVRRTTGKTFLACWPFLVIIGITVFSPVQYRIVLWAMMFQVACPGFFLSLALMSLVSPWPLWLRWVVGVLAASCATQSFASGILVWLLPLPLVWFTSYIREPRMRHIFGGLWLAVFAVTMSLYFTGLKNEVDGAFSYKQGDEETLRSDLSGFFKKPGQSIPYVMRFLGSHLGRGTSLPVMDASLTVGAISTLLYAGALGYLIWNWRRVDLRDRLMPWLLFGAYSIGAGCLVAMGRMWASSNGDNAVAPRYVIHAVPLTVSLIILVWQIFRDWQKQHRHSVPWMSRVAVGAAVTLVCMQGASWLYGCRLMEMWESSRLRGAVTTRFLKVMPNMDGNVPLNPHYAALADDLGLLDPPMLKDLTLNNFKLAPKLLSSNTAQLKQIEIGVDDDGYYGVARGFACLSSRTRVADGVFLAWRIPKMGRWEIFHVAQVSAMPLFLLETLSKDTQFVHIPGTHVGQEGLAGFSGKFPLNAIPEGVHDIMAWAYDARRGIAYPMVGYFELDTRGPRPKMKRLGLNPATVHLEKFLENAKPDAAP